MDHERMDTRHFTNNITFKSNIHLSYKITEKKSGIETKLKTEVVFKKDNMDDIM